MMSFRIIAAAVLLVLLLTGLYHSFKPLPPGLSLAAPTRPLQDVRLFADVTWRTASGERASNQTIFNEIFRLIGQAEQLVVLDMFLFNNSGSGDDFETLADALTSALIQRLEQVPELQVVVITDPLNTVYGGLHQTHLNRLRDAGVTLVVTDLRPLRDSNPAWSAVWRLCCQWFGNNPDGGWLPNAFDEGKVTLRSYLALLNFKANHRKTLVVDEAGKLRGLITSANPHAGSSQHWNTAISFTGPAALDLLKSEEAVIRISGVPVPPWPILESAPETAGSEELQGQVLTESAIRDAAIALINDAQKGDRLDMAMFYLSHRGVVEALKAAHKRGAQLRILLDRNLDAFGHAKNGIPNRQVALELNKTGVEVRWCNTDGEQCHNKLLMLRPANGDTRMLLGSANLTRRNIDDYNLETSLLVSGAANAEPLAAAGRLFDRLWSDQSRSAPAFSLPYEANADESRVRYWQYRVMEATGMSTF